MEDSKVLLEKTIQVDVLQRTKVFAIDTCLEALDSKDEFVVEGGILGLALGGPNAVVAIPALKKLAIDGRFGQPVAEALKKIQGSQDEAQR